MNAYGGGENPGSHNPATLPRSKAVNLKCLFPRFKLDTHYNLNERPASEVEGEPLKIQVSTFWLSFLLFNIKKSLS